MNTTHSDTDVLTTLGQKLQTAHTNLDAAGQMFADHDLESAFFDGVLTEKLATLNDHVLSVLELVAELTAAAIQRQAEETVSQIVDDAMKRVDAVQSGEAFGFPQTTGCEGCPIEGDCPEQAVGGTD